MLLDFFNYIRKAEDKNSASFTPRFGLLSCALRGNLKLPALHMVFSKSSYRDCKVVRFIQAKIISQMDFAGANSVICLARCEDLSAARAGVSA